MVCGERQLAQVVVGFAALQALVAAVGNERTVEAHDGWFAPAAAWRGSVGALSVVCVAGRAIASARI
jgi:hypothetical protein